LEFNVPSQHKYGNTRDNESGVDSYPYPLKEGQQYIKAAKNSKHKLLKLTFL